jgi:hypothetical protein
MSPVPSWPFPAAALIIDRFCLHDAPLFDRLMAIAIAESTACDEDKWWTWAMHGMSVDPGPADAGTWHEAEALHAQLEAASQARRAGAPDAQRLKAEALRAFYAAPLAVYLRAMSLRRSNAVALEYVTRRKIAQN